MVKCLKAEFYIASFKNLYLVQFDNSIYTRKDGMYEIFS